MANYILDLQTYAQNHVTMWTALTKISAAGYRYCDTTSVQEHTVTVRDGTTGPSCTLYLRQSDLYLVGFKTATGHVFAFADQAPSAYQTKLTMSVNYAHVYASAKNTSINRKTLVDAITAFDAHTGTTWSALSVPFLSMALLVSEAMRFKSIYEKMRSVAGDRSNGNTTKFMAWSSKVTSWNTDTDTLHGPLHRKLMDKPSKQDVKTWHHFSR